MKSATYPSVPRGSEDFSNFLSRIQATTKQFGRPNIFVSRCLVSGHELEYSFHPFVGFQRVLYTRGSWEIVLQRPIKDACCHGRCYRGRIGSSTKPSYCSSMVDNIGPSSLDVFSENTKIIVVQVAFRIEFGTVAQTISGMDAKYTRHCSRECSAFVSIVRSCYKDKTATVHSIFHCFDNLWI